ncbi:hypothetical protein J6A31_07605 [bacterium]|nr:hypothetical protein [bacterium]
MLKQINHIMYISVAPNDTSMLDFYKKLGFSHINNSVLLQTGTLID